MKGSAIKVFTKPQMSAGYEIWCQYRITDTFDPRVGRIHPLQTMNVCTNFHRIKLSHTMYTLKRWQQHLKHTMQMKRDTTSLQHCQSKQLDVSLKIHTDHLLFVFAVSVFMHEHTPHYLYGFTYPNTVPRFYCISVFNLCICSSPFSSHCYPLQCIFIALRFGT